MGRRCQPQRHRAATHRDAMYACMNICAGHITWRAYRGRGVAASAGVAGVTRAVAPGHAMHVRSTGLVYQNVEGEVIKDDVFVRVSGLRADVKARAQVGDHLHACQAMCCACMNSSHPRITHARTSSNVHVKAPVLEVASILNIDMDTSHMLCSCLAARHSSNQTLLAVLAHIEHFGEGAGERDADTVAVVEHGGASSARHAVLRGLSFGGEAGYARSRSKYHT